MKALTITNESVTREDLLELAHRIPGAWVGIRIAAVLLLPVVLLCSLWLIPWVIFAIFKGK